MVSDGCQMGVRWCQMVPDGVKWCQMVSDGVRWCHVVSDGVRWCQVVPDGARWCQMVPDDHLTPDGARCRHAASGVGWHVRWCILSVSYGEVAYHIHVGWCRILCRMLCIRYCVPMLYRMVYQISVEWHRVVLMVVDCVRRVAAQYNVH